VPELEVRERPPSTLRNIDGGPPGGIGAEGPRAPTINVKTSMTGPREVPALKVRERPPPTSTAGPREVPELKVQERPPST
jgi:hypothetical protein